jgi:hypothetical protein
MMVEKVERKKPKIEHFTDLRIWQEGIKIVKDIYLYNKRISKR